MSAIDADALQVRAERAEADLRHMEQQLAAANEAKDRAEADRDDWTDRYADLATLLFGEAEYEHADVHGRLSGILNEYGDLRAAKDRAEAEVAKMAAYLERCGHRRCDTAACNCGLWHDHGAERLIDNMRDAEQRADRAEAIVRGLREWATSFDGYDLARRQIVAKLDELEGR